MPASEGILERLNKVKRWCAGPCPKKSGVVCMAWSGKGNPRVYGMEGLSGIDLADIATCAPGNCGFTSPLLGHQQ